MPWWSALPKTACVTSPKPVPDSESSAARQVGAEHAGARDAAVARLEQQRRPRRASRARSAGRRPRGALHDGARQGGQAVAAEEHHADGAGRLGGRGQGVVEGPGARAARPRGSATWPSRSRARLRPRRRAGSLGRRAERAPAEALPGLDVVQVARAARARGVDERAAPLRAGAAGRSTACARPPTRPGSCRRGPPAMPFRTASSDGMLPALGVATSTRLRMRRAPAQVTGALGRARRAVAQVVAGHERRPCCGRQVEARPRVARGLGQGVEGLAQARADSTRSRRQS